MAKQPISNTFVVLPPLTQKDIIFGKNSDGNSVQEIIYIPSNESSDRIKCNHMEIESSGKTKPVILSKCGDLWGAEMGANANGVAIGNQIIWTNGTGDGDAGEARLDGSDLVRLGLERSSSANEALDIITELLGKYGQGSDAKSYNSFIIVDSLTAWVLETYEKHWVAIQIKSGFKHIANSYTITNDFDRKSEGIEDFAKTKGLWDGEGEFSFAKIFGDNNEVDGNEVFAKYMTTTDFCDTDMFALLRDKELGVCRDCDAIHPTQNSQVSVLNPTKPGVHWFTGTRDPSISVYKPFIFSTNATISKHTRCPDDDKTNPHTLYALHSEAIKKGTQVQDLLRSMEADCVKELKDVLDNIGEDLSEFDELFKDCVETEVKFYR